MMTRISFFMIFLGLLSVSMVLLPVLFALRRVRHHPPALHGATNSDNIRCRRDGCECDNPPSARFCRRCGAALPVVGVRAVA